MDLYGYISNKMGNDYNIQNDMAFRDDFSESLIAGGLSGLKNLALRQSAKLPFANPNYKKELKNLLNPKLQEGEDINNVRAVIGDISDDVLLLGKNNNIDLTGYQHFIDNSGKNHIFGRHVGANELDPRLIPLSNKDFERLPNVIYQNDKLEFLPATKRKLPRIKYTKQFDDGLQTYVEQIQNKTKRLNTKTMWKEKNQGAYANNSHLRTSETTPITNIINDLPSKFKSLFNYLIGK